MLGRAIALAAALVASLPIALAATQSAAHPLSGKIWDVRQQRYLTEQELLARLAPTDFVLLGEVHDNPEHHVRQTAVLSSLVRAGRRPALAMEQFDLEHQPAIDAALATGSTAEGIALAGHFDRKGWQWKDYEPLLRIAVSAGLPVVAANLSRGVARAVATGGLDQLEPSPSILAMSTVWTTAREDALVRAIVDGHCGQLRPQDAGPMTRAQRARDAIMADAMLAHRAKGAVLIAGAGHARRDVAVPLYLRARAPDASITSVAMIEVQAGSDDPAAYEIAAAEGSTEPVFDYLWFSPRFERVDPCAGFTLPPRAR